MSLLTIAEVLSGETLVSAGGPVDRLTAMADDVDLVDLVERLPVEPATVGIVQEELALV